jgi:hypothetical protein
MRLHCSVEFVMKREKAVASSSSEAVQEVFNTHPNKKQRQPANAFVNSLSQAEIDKAVANWANGRSGSKFHPSSSKGGQKPFLLLVDQKLWINPNAFAMTKDYFSGYCTYHLKHGSEWTARVAVHQVLWRFFNNYELIESDKEISHRSGQRFLADPSTLLCERGVINRSRTACHEEKWHTERKCEGCLRCPHNPACMSPLAEPDFTSYDTFKPIGFGVLVSLRDSR